MYVPLLTFLLGVGDEFQNQHFNVDFNIFGLNRRVRMFFRNKTKVQIEMSSKFQPIPLVVQHEFMKYAQRKCYLEYTAPPSNMPFARDSTADE